MYLSSLNSNPVRFESFFPIEIPQLYLLNTSNELLMSGTVERFWLEISRWSVFIPGISETVDWALNNQLPTDHQRVDFAFHSRLTPQYTHEKTHSIKQTARNC